VLNDEWFERFELVKIPCEGIDIIFRYSIVQLINLIQKDRKVTPWTC
jgi:hypothetical protein